MSLTLIVFCFQYCVLFFTRIVFFFLTCVVFFELFCVLHLWTPVEERGKGCWQSINTFLATNNKTFYSHVETSSNHIPRRLRNVPYI